MNTSVYLPWLLVCIDHVALGSMISIFVVVRVAVFELGRCVRWLLLQMPNTDKVVVPHPLGVGCRRVNRRVAVVHVDRAAGVVRQGGDPHPRHQSAGVGAAIVLLDLVVQGARRRVSSIRADGRIRSPEDDVAAVGFFDMTAVGDGPEVVIVADRNEDREVGEVRSAARRRHAVGDGDHSPV